MADSFKNLVQIRPKGGIVSDITPGELDDNFYTRGSNITFRSGSAQRADGYSTVFDACPVDPWLIQFVVRGNAFYWIVCGSDAVWVWDTTAWTDITPVGLSAVLDPNDWTSTVLNGIPVFNNGLNPPFYWDLNVANPGETLPGWPEDDRCKAIRAFKYHLLALNITRAGVELPDLVTWSDAAEPGTLPNEWIPTAANQAGDVILAETAGPIIDAAPLRGQLMIYKAAAVHMGQFIGGQFVYSFRRLFGVGVIARNCIVAWRNQHLFVGSGDILVTDGTNLTSCIDNRIRDYFFNTLNPDQYQNIFAVHNPFHNEILIFYATGTDEQNNSCVTFDYVENTWGVRDVPGIQAANVGFIPGTSNTWDNIEGTWDSVEQAWEESVFNPAKLQVVMGGANQGLYGLDISNAADGDPIPAYVIKDGIAFGVPAARKLVKRIWPRFAGGEGTVYVSTWGSDYPGQAPQWGAETEYNIGQDTWVSQFVSGKYISIRVRSNGVQRWRLDGFDLDVSLQGSF